MKPAPPVISIFINFSPNNVNDDFYLVDLPGYGYANANVSVKEKWGKMIERYLHTSEMLYAVFLLIDIRHEPGKNDRQMYEWMTSQGYFPIIIATKMDKINRSQLPKHMKMIREERYVTADVCKNIKDFVAAFFKGPLSILCSCQLTEV